MHLHTKAGNFYCQHDYKKIINIFLIRVLDARLISFIIRSCVFSPCGFKEKPVAPDCNAKKLLNWRGVIFLRAFL